jgi:ComF family protein
LSIIHSTILNIRTKIEQMLPAQPCVLCGAMSHDGVWCAACDQALPYYKAPHCPSCALPVSTGEVCGQCLKYPPLFAATTAVYVYSFPVDRLIQAMKYGEQLILAQAFAKKMALQIDPAKLPDLLVPMPLHPAKLRVRGYNQAHLLAMGIARELALKLLSDGCRRVRDTPPQTTLPWRERKKNLRDAFCCDVDLSGCRVALIDDVLTTGASLNALAEAVKKRGAAQVSAWVVARTLPHSEDR